MARERRTQINHTLSELNELLCPGQERLDKLTVVRLATATIKLHEFLRGVGPRNHCLDRQRAQTEDTFNNLIEGFVMILSPNGQILHVSDNIARTLEHPPHNVIGESIHSLVHPDDHTEVNRNVVKETALNPSTRCERRKRKCTREPALSNTSHNKRYRIQHSKENSNMDSYTNSSSERSATPIKVESLCGGLPNLPSGLEDLNNTFDTEHFKHMFGTSRALKRRFFCRMKCVQQRKLKRLVKSWGYKTVFCNGHQLYEEREDGMLVCKGFVGVVRPLQPPAIFEIPLVEGSFMTHHSLDMKFIFTDKRIQTALGYQPEDILGQSVYNLVHTGDIFRLARFHSNLLKKGECVSGYYRLCSHSKEWVVIQSQANIVYNKKEHGTPDYVVCISYIVGQTSHRLPDDQVQAPATSVSVSEHSVTIETAAHPVQVSDLLDAGEFRTLSGDKAIPSRIARVQQAPFYAQAIVPQLAMRAPYIDQYPISRTDQYTQPCVIESVSNHGSHGNSSHGNSSHGNTVLRARAGLRLDNVRGRGDHTICHVPQPMVCHVPSVGPLVPRLQHEPIPQLQYELPSLPTVVPTAPYIEHLHVGNYLRYLEDEHVYYNDANRVS